MDQRVETATEQLFRLMALAGFLLAAWNLIQLPKEPTTSEVTPDERALLLEGTTRALASVTPHPVTF